MHSPHGISRSKLKRLPITSYCYWKTHVRQRYFPPVVCKHQNRWHGPHTSHRWTASSPPPSPNTVAFLIMMGSSVSGGATITPNTLNAITGVLASSAAAVNGTNSSQPHPLSVSHLPPLGFEQCPQNYPNGTSMQSSDSHTTINGANTAANELFLLSQAHQSLRNVRRFNVPTTRMVMMMSPLRMPPASKAQGL
jgi:hypothetical protein